MGKYVYLEDEEIVFNKLLINFWNMYDFSNNEKQLQIGRTLAHKLSQKPKTLEDIKYNEINATKGNKKYKHYYCKNNIKRVGIMGDKKLISFDLFREHIRDREPMKNWNYNIEELEAILNKAKKLFKEN